MSKRISITGAAGFIGYHLSELLLTEGHQLLGVDVMNDYYDPKLKLMRLKMLDQYEDFNFEKIDIADRGKVTETFARFKPQVVVNLAAMAGVRHSIEDPYSYMNSNLVGFLNIIELCRTYKVKNFVYASSSSVYGANTKSPFSVEDKTDSPISFYAATKKTNELIAHSYSHLFNLHTTGLRFFTVYGPWGRPDMAMYLFADNILNGRPIRVFNHGNMKRDFTYISDVVSGIKLAIDRNCKCEVFNIGNSQNIELLNMIKLIEENLGKRADIVFENMQPGDVPESLADIEKTKFILGYSPKTPIEKGIAEFVRWFKEYNSVPM